MKSLRHLVLLRNDLICHHVLPSLEKNSKGCDKKGWHADHDHIGEEHYRVFKNPENGLILLIV